MDQLKDILRQAIKYRFWIAAGLSILFPMIAYYASAGSIQEQAKNETAKIKQANDKLNPYKSPSTAAPTPRYATVVSTKTEDLSKVVSKTHHDLYERQAPIFTWPAGFEERFPKWGRKWPDNVAGTEIDSAIRDYVDAYPDYVRSVYQTVRPWDSKTGEGVVVTRPVEGLLLPAPFTVDNLPSLKQIWNAQEKIWLQHTLLDVVNSVNKDAKTWDDALIKQLSAVDVGVEAAMDQTWNAKKAADRDQLKTSPEIEPGNAPAAANSPEPAKADSKAAASTSKADPNDLAYLEPGGGQYRLFPIYLSVTIDQRHLNDLFHALRNSPMAIQIKEVEISRPEERVKRPVKGEETALGGMSLAEGGGSDMARYSGASSGSSGKAAMRAYMEQMSKMNQSMAGMGGGMFGDASSKAGPASGGLDAARGKVDLREINKTGKKKAAKKAEPTKVETLDPYYFLVDVRINGFARFYNPPAESPAPGETIPAGPGDVNAPQNPAAGNVPTANVPTNPANSGTDTQGPAVDPAKPTPKPNATAPSVEAKADAPKPNDAPAADASKTDAPTPDAPKADAPKADAPKADAPKADAPKADAPKAEAKPEAKKN